MKTTQEEFYLNKETFLILQKYYKNKKAASKTGKLIIGKGLENLLMFLKNIHGYSENKTIFGISTQIARETFKEYKTILDTLLKVKLLEIVKNHHKGETRNYKFTDKYNSSKLFKFTLDEIATYLKNPGRDLVVYNIVQQFNFLPIINSENNFVKPKQPSLKFNMRKSTPIAPMSREKRAALTVNNEPLVEFDIRSSSFTLTTNRLMKFLPENEQAKLKHWLLTDIYVAIAEANGNKTTRDDVKESFMQFLFSANQGNNGKSKIETNVRIIKKFFQTETPAYWELIKDKRKKKLDKNGDSICEDYFRMETEFIEEISKQLYKNNIKSISIYDAILVAKKDQAKVEEITNKIVTTSGKTIQMSKEIKTPVAKKLTAFEKIMQELQN